jgi:hypothetical protein
VGCRGALVGLLVAIAGCGGGGGRPADPKPKAPVAERPPAREGADANEPKVEPFVPTSGPGDAPVAFARDERSSWLDVSLPRGRPREKWRTELSGPRREACRGPCASADRAFVVAAGNRVALVESTSWQLFDSHGKRIETGKIESGGVRLDRVSGAIVPEEGRGVDARVAAHGGQEASVAAGAVHVGARAIEGRFDTFDIAIDDSGIACAVVRQGKDLLLWTVPLQEFASIGRLKLGAGARHALGPPALGKWIRVFVLDIGLLALGLDGKRLWEKKGLLPTGGVTVMANDVVLVADGGRILTIDTRGQMEEIYGDKGVVFVTPPIVNATGTLFVGSQELVHALAFP